MGKPRSFSRKAKKLAQKKGLIPDESSSSAGAAESKYTIDQILDRAESFIEEYNYEMAKKFCQRALEMDADNVRALETCSSLLLEAGDVENAKHCLGRAVTVQPDDGHTKFMSLGQLFEGQQSLQLYQQGIEILSKKVSEKRELKHDLSSALCSVADLYMTDLCDEPDAEAECTKAIQCAIEAEETNPEAWQTKARLEIIKSQFEDARKSLNHSLSLWLPSYEAVLENRPLEGGARAFDPVEVCPLLYTTRICTAKMLIELEEWDSATKVLDGLLEEDEEVVETWYLLGWVNKLRATFESKAETGNENGKGSQNGSGNTIRIKETEEEGQHGLVEGYNSNARYYLEQAKKVHATVKPTDDDEMMKHIEELLEELGPGEPEDTNEGEEEEEENWETDEEDMDQN